ncbi:MAG: hypothetical protein M3Z03_01615 [Actinomycetota bacterium]|nr:hypothetical protein [Actinomycetota bacterium]
MEADLGPRQDLDPSSERQADRQRRLHGSIDRARIAAGGIDGERLLFVLGAVFVPLGLLLIGVAWKGTANTGAVFEQLPFIVSGGLGGLALVVLGGFLYFGWWHTRTLREAREHAARSNEVAEATLEELRAMRRDQQELLERLAAPVPAPGTRARKSR